MFLNEKFPILSGDTDPRVRRTLVPCRVVTIVGDVSGAETLLGANTSQVAIEETVACVMKNTSDGACASVVLDFGMEVHGNVNLLVRNLITSKGTFVSGDTVDIRIRTGESISEAMTPIGVKNTTNDHAPRDNVFSVGYFSSIETPETGFRFACVELLTPDVTVHIRAVTATLIVRELDYIGSFESSDPLLNRIYDTAAYTVHLNMQRYLWDGIKRDRLVWAGDMNTEINTILAVFGGERDVVRRSLDLLRDTTPDHQVMNGLSSYTLWWAQCHYDWYMATGDHKYLMEQKDYLVKILPFFLDQIDEKGSEKMVEGRFFDWPTNSIPEQKHAGLQGLMCYTLRSCAQMLHYMGEDALSARCIAATDRLLAHCPDPCGNKQAAAFLALSGVADSNDMVEHVILLGGAKGLSTFLGYFTLQAVAETGRISDMLSLIREYWGGMLEMGATTFWEDFDVDWMKNSYRIDQLPQAGMTDIHGDFGAYCYKNLRHSLCHGWASGPAPVLAKYVLGIRSFVPGMKAVRFAPELGDLDWAKGSIPTPHGVINVELERQKDGRTIGKIDVPKGVDVITK